MAADWTRRFDASYRFMRVSRATGLETARVTGVRPGGVIDRNLDTAIKESGSLDVVGSLDLGPDLLRVYLDATFPDGSSESVALGTFLVSVTDRDTDGASSTSSASLSGRLKELDDDQFGQPFMLPAGTDLVAYAAQIAEAAGLDVVADESDYASTEPLYYGIQTGGEQASADGSKLSVVNDLLARAGFDSAWTDPTGAVRMTRSAGVAERPLAWTFEEGVNARFLRDVSESFDTTGVANTVYAVFTGAPSEGEEPVTVIGTAVDDDPASPWSTVSMGRTVTSRADYQQYATQQQADAKAAELLASSRSVAKRETVRHVYAPIGLGDAVQLSYASGGVSGRFAVRTMRLSLTAGCLTETEVRSYVRVA